MLTKELPNPNNRSGISLILIIGYATLLSLIITSGFISSYQVSLIRSSVTNLEQDHINQLNTIFKIRELISEIYFEARDIVRLRRADPNIKQFTALPTNLNSELEKQLQTIEDSSISKTDEWKKFNLSLAQFTKTAINPFYFQINGLAHQQETFKELDEVVKKIRLERTKIADQSNALQLNAEKAINTTTNVSIAVGLIVAGLTVVEIQKRLRQLQLSFRVISQAREFNRNIINGVVNALFTLDTSGSISSANQAFYNLFNLTPDVLGRSYQDFLKNEAELYQKITELYENSNIINNNYCGRINLMPNDKLLRADLYITALKINEQPIGFILILVDVTEMELAQQERTRNQALVAIGQIAAQVAHEIKNPLGSIKLNLTYLGRTIAKNEEAIEVISEIQSGVDRLNKTISELSTFVRPKELMLSNIDINLNIEEQLAFIKDKIQEKNIQVECQFQSDLPLIKADSHELGKAFINFLVNGVEASKEAGKIIIATKSLENKVLISFTDFGIGMTRETIARIFEPFFTTKPTGTGLGMSIAKRVIEMHKGSVQINSKIGEGSQINIELPIT
ncbi:MAG: PAS domain-containing protein [Blastocatellia bacterium]|nr:PAS domain-containing protein [Blastocatellia bacterium]